MPVLDRLVRRLRLTASHEDHARHGRVLIEDALRTASFGDESRLIVVRSLALGRISSRDSATTWSRRLEDVFKHSRLIPVSVHAKSASTAEAVYFADRNEPWFLLVQRTLAGQPCLEWFWRSAVPDWKPALSTSDTLRLCFRTLAAQGGLPLTLELISRLSHTRSPNALLESLEPADLCVLRTELGFPLSNFQTGAEETAPPASASHRLPSLLTHVLGSFEAYFVSLWGPEDIRTHWLAAARLVAKTETRFLLHRPKISTEEIQQLVRHWHRASASNHPFLKLSEPHARTTPAQLAASSHRSLHSPQQGRPSGPVTETPAPADLIQERLFTRAGGLFFLIPLLQHAGFPKHLESLSPDAGAALPWHFLKFALKHARINEDDPVAVALRDTPLCPHPVGRWLRATNRRALHLAAMNLRTIVSRPALVAISGTHVDVFFRASEADIQLRRSGLDLDPGWVPWLGRAVAFHFNRED